MYPVHGATMTSTVLTTAATTAASVHCVLIMVLCTLLVAETLQALLAHRCHADGCMIDTLVMSAISVMLAVVYISMPTA